MQGELFEARFLQRHANETARVGDEEIDPFWCRMLGSDDEIAFILAMLVIDNNDDFAARDRRDCLLYRVEADSVRI